ncbi:MAG TPA: flagellar motor protein MotD [Steroidobacteraceae bacterium]|jgi:chemotaxis protein MotB|nr:flagellar motor protein MotD [Steroidobacteraceae bacterium]
MARKKKHEEHVNAEAWAIPYGDLVTLLFALFTVMYAISSVNEGKFRVLSDSMIAAFHGSPKSMRPVNIGENEPGKGGDKLLTGVTPTVLLRVAGKAETGEGAIATARNPAKPEVKNEIPGALIQMQHRVQEAMQSLIDAKLVTVRRENQWLEIEINADILFPSGSAAFISAADPVLDKLADVLKPFPNSIRVEGHTDNRPIKTAAYPSNWELSAARAASVVHQFTQQGVDPLRLEIVGYGEFHPRQSNDTAEGRNANRRVAVLVLEELAPGAPSAAKKDQDPGNAPTALEVADAAGAAKSPTETPNPPAVKAAIQTAIAGGSDKSIAAAAKSAAASSSGPAPAAAAAKKTVLVKDKPP